MTIFDVKMESRTSPQIGSAELENTQQKCTVKAQTEDDSAVTCVLGQLTFDPVRTNSLSCSIQVKA